MASQRITAETPVTTLADADLLYKDNNSTGSAAITYANLKAQLLASPTLTGTPAAPTAVAGTNTTQLATTAFATAADTIVTNALSSRINARAPQQGLVSDSSSNVINIGNTVPSGTSDLTLSVPYTPTSLAADTYPIYSTGINAVGIKVRTDGTIVARQNGSGDATPSTGAIAAGKASHIAYVRSGTTGTYYINGVAAGTTADSRNYSAATNAIYAYGQVSNPLIYNRALSAAEITALYESGAPASADFNSASNTSLITGDNSTFASDTGWWTKAGAATISGGVYSFGSNADYLSRANILTTGKRYRVTFTATLTSGKCGVQFGTSAAVYEVAASGTYTTEMVATGPNLYIGSVNITGAGTIDNVTLYPLGLLAAFDPQQSGSGLVWNDMSGNGAHLVLPASGVRWALPSAGATHVRGTTSTNGNQQLLGAAVLPANCQIIRIRARSRTGTPTITLGTASGGAQLVASVALSTTWKNLTIALTDGIVSAVSSIWVGSNSTDVVEVDATVEPLSL